MTYDAFFRHRLDGIRAEGRHRVFADSERHCGHFPALSPADPAARSPSGAPAITLGMGRHPAVLEAMIAAVRAHAAGSGGTRHISGIATRSRGRSASPCSGPGLYHIDLRKTAMPLRPGHWVLGHPDAGRKGLSLQLAIVD